MRQLSNRLEGKVESRPEPNTSNSGIAWPVAAAERVGLRSEGLAEDDGIVTIGVGRLYAPALIQITGTLFPRQETKRRAERRGAESAAAGADVCGDGPLRFDEESPAAGAGCRRARAIRSAGTQLRGDGRKSVRHEQEEPGHRAHHWARAGDYAAGADDRVRRQPHFDAWRFWRAGVWNWHQRNRACAGDAVPDAI